jgi:hypothetical protein
MFIAVFVERLRPGKTYDDFIDAWYPDKGFGFPGRGPFVARNLEDDRELLTGRRRFGASTRSRPSSW